MAQIERRQRGIHVQNIPVLLTEPLPPTVHIHPVVELFQGGIAVLFNIFTSMLT
ncbi:hypothetical protein D3C86_695600 [compost metagenome]